MLETRSEDEKEIKKIKDGMKEWINGLYGFMRKSGKEI